METTLTIFSRTFGVYYNRTERMWVASETDADGNVVWLERAISRDLAMVYVGVQAAQK